MAAPINFGQLQGQVLSAIWLLDLLGDPGKRKPLLDELKEILVQTQREKAELDMGRSAKTAIARLYEEIERATGEADKIRAKAKADAQKIEDSTKESMAALNAKAAEIEKRESAIQRLEKEADKRAADLAKRADDLDALGAKLESQRQELDSHASLVAADRQKLDDAMSEFRRKVG